MSEITLTPDCALRMWCLERAFEKRALTGVKHMEVTNVAEEYFLWITEGVSQSNRQEAAAVPAGLDESGMS